MIDDRIYKLDNLRNKEILKLITFNFAPDLYFFCWKGFLDFKKKDIGLLFKEYKRKHVIFQTCFNLSRIQLGNRTIDLLKPPDKGRRHRQHEIEYPIFTFTTKGRKVWYEALEDGFWDKLIEIPKEYLLNIRKFIEYFHTHYFFDREPTFSLYHEMIKKFEEKMPFELPKEGDFIYDGLNFMIFNYIDENKNHGRYLEGEIKFLQVLIFCASYNNILRLYFTKENLISGFNNNNEHHTLCHHEDQVSKMFFINSTFTQLRSENKKQGKVVNLEDTNAAYKGTYYPNFVSYKRPSKRIYYKKSRPSHKKRPYKPQKIIPLPTIENTDILRAIYNQPEKAIRSDFIYDSIP